MSILAKKDGQPLLITEDFAKLHNIKNGQEINNETFIAHCKHNIARLKLLIASENKVKSN